MALDWRLRLVRGESTHSLHCPILHSIHPKLSTFTVNLPPIVKFNHQFTAKLSTFTYILPPIVKFLSIHPKLLIFTCNSPQIDFDWFQLEGNSQMAMVLMKAMLLMLMMLTMLMMLMLMLMLIDGDNCLICVSGFEQAPACWVLKT